MRLASLAARLWRTMMRDTSNPTQRLARQLRDGERRSARLAGDRMTGVSRPALVPRRAGDPGRARRQSVADGAAWASRGPAPTCTPAARPWVRSDRDQRRLARCRDLARARPRGVGERLDTARFGATLGKLCDVCRAKSSSNEVPSNRIDLLGIRTGPDTPRHFNNTSRRRCRCPAHLPG